MKPLPRCSSALRQLRLAARYAGLPAHLWSSQRRKRSYVNQVLARAEIQSGYEPARRLWARTRSGHYLPNPAMRVRAGATGRTDDSQWRPVYQALNLRWVNLGTAHTEPIYTSLTGLVEAATQRPTEPLGVLGGNAPA